MYSRRSLIRAVAAVPALSLLGCATVGNDAGAPSVIDDTSRWDQDPVWAGWREQRFPGKRPTRYMLDADPHTGSSIIKARASGSASMLRKRVDVAPADLGWVSFSWRAEEINLDADLGNASATDAPVRVVLAFEGDRSRWSARDSMLNEMSRLLMGEDMPYATLVYTWAGHNLREEVVTNPRTQTVRNLILESGAERLGQWLHYQRDVRADFRRVFGEEPGTLASLALMTDADNTGSQAEGWYRAVRLQKA